MSRAKPFIIAFVILLVVLLLAGGGSITGIFNLVLLEPMLNGLILLSKYLFSNFGLAIIALTIIIRVLMFPLTMRQLRSSRAMQEIQPKLQELQKKYGKDKQRLSEETMKLYKEHAVNPLGCAFPMLIQFPIWIALYQSVIQALAYAPENLFGLSKHLYSWSAIQGMVPLNNHFLGLDLARGNIIMAILVGGSMWVLQKMSTQPSTDPRQQSMSRMMLWMMPLMFGFFALSFPSGLSLYWVVSNIISIVMQYHVTGWGTLKVPSLPRRLPQPANIPARTTGTPEGGERAGGGVIPQQEGAGADSVVLKQRGAVGGDVISQRKKARHGKHRDKRKVRGRGR